MFYSLLNNIIYILLFIITDNINLMFTTGSNFIILSPYIWKFTWHEHWAWGLAETCFHCAKPTFSLKVTLSPSNADNLAEKIIFLAKSSNSKTPHYRFCHSLRVPTFIGLCASSSTIRIYWSHNWINLLFILLLKRFKNRVKNQLKTNVLIKNSQVVYGKLQLITNLICSLDRSIPSYQ